MYFYKKCNMDIEELKKYLQSNYGGYAIFETPCFNDAIIGISENGNLIYSYEKMVESLAQEYIKSSSNEDEAYTDAMEFIDYNTIRTIPYMGEFKPIILYELNEIM